MKFAELKNRKINPGNMIFNCSYKEKEKQLEDQKKLVEEMKRKAEQGSMQLQGEVQELALEKLLQNAFPV